MRLVLEAKSPLAQAIVESRTGPWLVLKDPALTGTTYFRARVKEWDLTANELDVRFESWEEHMEQQAKLQGL